MKIFAFFSVCFFSLFAIASTYSGEGEWKSNNGGAGEYYVNATIEADGDLIKLSQTLTFADRTINIVINLRPLDDTFYDVINGESGEVIGHGYCWPLEDDDKLCHSVSHYNDYVVESTIKKHGDMIYRIGSKTNVTDASKIVWKDSLELDENDDDDGDGDDEDDCSAL